MSGRRPTRNSTRGRTISLPAPLREVLVIDNQDGGPPDPDYLCFLQMIQDENPTLPLYDVGSELCETQLEGRRAVALRARGEIINPRMETSPSTQEKIANWEVEFTRMLGRVERAGDETQATNNLWFQQTEQGQDVNPQD